MIKKNKKELTVSGFCLGECLAEARLEKGVSIRKAARDLSVPYKQLQDLEKNRPELLPSIAYARDLLRAYCAYLNYDFRKCWDQLSQCDFSKKHDSLNHKHFQSWPKVIRRLGIVLAALAVLFFLGLRVNHIFAAPPIIIYAPQDETITQMKQIEVSGRSEKESEITINNRLVFVDNNGEFRTEIDLQKGLNLIKITGKKRYGQTKEVELRVLLKE